MALTDPQQEFLQALFDRFEEDQQACKRGFQTNFMTDNAARFEEQGEECWMTARQWEILHDIARENYGIEPNDYD